MEIEKKLLMALKTINLSNKVKSLFRNSIKTKIV